MTDDAKYVITEEELQNVKVAIKDFVPKDKIGTEIRKIPHKVKCRSLEDEIKKSRENTFKDLQKFIDDPDSREGCDLGTISIAALVRWLSARGYDCD